MFYSEIDVPPMRKTKIISSDKISCEVLGKVKENITHEIGRVLHTTESVYIIDSSDKHQITFAKPLGYGQLCAIKAKIWQCTY